MSLQNIGGREVKVQSVTLTFKHAEGESFSIPGQNYYPTLESKNPVILPPFRVKPQEVWEHSILFFKQFNREDDKLYRSISSNIRSDIFSKKEIQGKDVYAEADPVYTNAANDFFNNRFKWKEGEYTLEISVSAIPEKASLSKSFRFTLFESDANELKSYANDYKYGLGVYYFEPEIHSGISVQIKPI